MVISRLASSFPFAQRGEAGVTFVFNPLDQLLLALRIVAEPLAEEAGGVVFGSGPPNALTNSLFAARRTASLIQEPLRPYAGIAPVALARR